MCDKFILSDGNLLPYFFTSLTLLRLWFVLSSILIRFDSIWLNSKLTRRKNNNKIFWIFSISIISFYYFFFFFFKKNDVFSLFFLLLLSDEMRPKFPTHNFLRFSSSCILKVNKLLSRNEQVSLASFFFHFSLFLWLCDELCAAHFISIEYYRKLAYKYTRFFFCFWLRSLEGWFLIALSL